MFFTTLVTRTLGDVLCDNSAMDGTQKWVLSVSLYWSVELPQQQQMSKQANQLSLELNNRCFSPKCGSPSILMQIPSPSLFHFMKKIKENNVKKICQWDAFPRWVTLQPDSDYNPREKCKEKRKLDLEGITREIIDEISDNRRWETSQSDNRRWGKNLNSFRFAFKLSDHAANSPNWRQKKKWFSIEPRWIMVT